MSITVEDIKTLMKEAGVDEAVIEKLRNDVPLLSQGLDSIDLPTIAAATEKKYSIDLSDVDASKVRTLDGYVKLLNEKCRTNK